MTFRFLEPAEAEFLEAIAYYSAIQAELGVIYWSSKNEVVIVAVAHQRKRADYWSKRIE